jgi:two-component system, OmpR family, response regulator
MKRPEASVLRLLGNNAWEIVTVCDSRRDTPPRRAAGVLMTLPAQQILIVEDDPAIRELLRDCFEGEGFMVSEAQDGRAMMNRLAKGGIDLVTLDLTLGGESGLALAAQIRAVYKLPIVMITGKGETIDRVVGLEMGADDYIAKPFHPREVIARIRAVLRRSAPATSLEQAAQQPAERLSFDGWALDIGRRELSAPDKSLRALTTAEFNLLEALARRPQRVLSRDAIMDLLKGHDWTPFDRSIDAIISRLRRKIEADPGAPKLIKTVRGIGYVFASEVK